jgi:zinc and cadmium transporter
MPRGFLLFLVVIAVVSYVGAAIPLVGGRTHRSLLIPMSFSGGVLLGAAFFHMIPECAVLLDGMLGWPLLAGFLVIFSMERFILVHPDPEHAEEHGHAHHIHLGVSAYAGMSFHSVLDGLAIASACRLRPDLGGVVLLALVLHKMPDGFALSTLMLLDRWSRPKVLWLMALFALITPAGALASIFFLADANSRIVAGAIALSAGTFLAVATSDVLPQLRRYDDQRLWPLVALFAGLAFSWLGRLIER